MVYDDGDNTNRKFVVLRVIANVYCRAANTHWLCVCLRYAGNRG